MNKKIIRDLKNIAKNYKHHQEYIDIARYIIFLVTKMVFILKVEDIGLKEFTYKYYLYYNNNSILKLFNEYNSYNLEINRIEEEIFDTIRKNMTLLSTSRFVPGILYENMLTKKEKNFLGQVYTPDNILKEMLDNVLINIDESYKIIDPACGGGYFLIEAFNKIKKKLIDDNNNMSEIEINKYILENMLYGNDMDEFSVFLTKTGLLLNCMCYNVELNIFNTDFLLEWNRSNCNEKFDIIIGNPPYIGHKKTENDYKKELQKKYGQVYYDKSDVSYCFFQKGKELLKTEGTLSYITSRYFMEALYGQRLREFINNNFKIVAITDFNGIKVFKDANVSPVIIVLKNKNKSCKNENIVDYIRYNTVDNRPIKFKYNQSNMNKKYWNILSKEELNIFNKIDSKCNYRLKDICDINQGIITGCDKAFIVTTEEIETFNLEKRLIHKWIKNSNIKNGVIKFENKHIIYSNLIDDEKKYPNTIKHLLKYKDKLEKRRECKNGIRKWYELQWGRDLDKFKQPKIVFPYKSNCNKFCFDSEGYLCSADVYIITNVNKQVSYEYLTLFLNSKVFEFYFKCVGKKVGEKLFEYYPNKINDLGIFIQDKRKTMGKNTNNSIDKMLFRVLNISKHEEQIIDNYIR